MPRIARVVGVGYPHHIIQRGNNKQPIFFNDEDKRFYLNLLKKYSSECGCDIYAYCLMPNHVHILATPLNDLSLAKSMQKLSLVFTQYINKKYNRTGRLWECRYYSSLVDKDEYLWTVCKYIERNPVRATIVKEPWQYSWSSAKCRVDDKESSFIKLIWQNHSERKEYADFLTKVDEEGDIAKIRKATANGKLLGSQEFIKKTCGALNIEIDTRPKGRPRKK